MTLTRVGGFTLTRRVGSGGEADVFEVAERPGEVCKRYRRADPERAEKLAVMIGHPPAASRSGRHVAVAWPTDIVRDDAGHVIGFLMPRIDLASSVPVFQVFNPATRLRVAPGFTWRYLVRTARNVAAIVDAVHRAGHVVGDLNESNLLVDRRALVALVDCDSMQVADPASGRVFRSPVGKPEFLAPELHGRDLSTTDRTPQSDAFALGVLIHQLLAEGVHPYAGVWRGRGDPADIGTRIARGWVAGRPGWSPVDRPPYALPARALPAPVRRLLRRSMSRRTRVRPSPAEWVPVLEALDGGLRSCARSPHHLHASRRCPWCDRIDRGLPDPFPGPSGVSTLTPRPPSRPTLVRAAIARGARRAGRHAARRGWIALYGASLAYGGWRWPLVAPALVALALPVAWAVLTPSRHLLRAANASLRTFVTSATASAGVVALHVDWPGTVRVASALAAVVHGLVLPAGTPAWASARRRLGRKR